MKDIKIENTYRKLILDIKDYFESTGYKKAVLGLSGGIDSALVAYLLKDALGKENVTAIMMPYKSSNKNSLAHAKLVVEDLGINYKIIEITPMIDAFFDTYERDANLLRRGNKMARERMSILYDFSSKEKSLVIGTSNKTEIYLGYSTQFGDSASAMNPIGDLFKRDVYSLAKFLNIPSEIISKKPSADLWEGQTDEDELGLTYDEADEILDKILNQKLSKEEIIASCHSEEIVNRIFLKMKNSEYKRNMPLILKLK